MVKGILLSNKVQLFLLLRLSKLIRQILWEWNGFQRRRTMGRRVGGQVVASYSDDLSSNPADFSVNFVLG